MEIDLPITLVFLDTNIYLENNFAFDSPLFSALKTRIENNQIKLLSTQITNSEVESQIKSRVSEAIVEIERMKKKAYILRNSRNNSIKSIFNTW